MKRETGEQCVVRASPENSAKHDNKGKDPGTLPINLWVADSPTVQPLDFTVLSEAAATPVPHRETTETLYKLSQIVCVKARIPVILLNCPLNCS